MLMFESLCCLLSACHESLELPMRGSKSLTNRVVLILHFVIATLLQDVLSAFDACLSSVSGRRCNSELALPVHCFVNGRSSDDLN